MVATLKEQLESLTSQIQKYLNDEITIDQLGQSTMGIIADDKFDTLDERLQDAIYTLDNNELNQLTKEDISKIKEDIEDRLSES
jgi:hypothetical protein